MRYMANQIWQWHRLGVLQFLLPDGNKAKYGRESEEGGIGHPSHNCRKPVLPDSQVLLSRVRTTGCETRTGVQLGRLFYGAHDLLDERVPFPVAPGGVSS